jgi:hypothetical protein
MNKKNFKLILAFIAVGLIFSSCSDDDTPMVSGTVSSDNVKAMVEIDNVSDQINNLLDDYFVSEGIAARSGELAKDSQACYTKTVVLDLQNQVVTLDFGDGCTLNSGDIVKGKIVLVYAIDISAQTYEVNYTYKDFYFNDLSITGENKIEGVRENTNGNPQSVLTVNETITWLSGDYANRKGTKTREFVEGFGTRTYLDNVFLITGNWTDTFNNGTVIKGTVVESLKRQMTCNHFVSGKLKLEKNSIYGILDFGDGTCDAVAIFTLSTGTEIEIAL